METHDGFSHASGLSARPDVCHSLIGHFPSGTLSDILFMHAIGHAVNMTQRLWRTPTFRRPPAHHLTRHWDELTRVGGKRLVCDPVGRRGMARARSVDVPLSTGAARRGSSRRGCRARGSQACRCRCNPLGIELVGHIRRLEGQLSQASPSTVRSLSCCRRRFETSRQLSQSVADFAVAVRILLIRIERSDSCRRRRLTTVHHPCFMIRHWPHPDSYRQTSADRSPSPSGAGWTGVGHTPYCGRKSRLLSLSRCPADRPRDYVAVAVRRRRGDARMSPSVPVAPSRFSVELQSADPVASFVQGSSVGYALRR